MESHKAGSSETGLKALMQGAIDDLRDAGDEASEELRLRINAALEQLREAAASVGGGVRGSAVELQSQAEDGTDELLERVDAVRRWIRGASADLVDELQAELDRRRDQLGIARPAGTRADRARKPGGTA